MIVSQYLAKPVLKQQAFSVRQNPAYLNEKNNVLFYLDFTELQKVFIILKKKKIQSHSTETV